MEVKSIQNPEFRVALAAGALAGLAVDVTLFPLDTIKTRLQSASGFYKAGGFRNIYSGLASVVVGSSPGSATFFCTYEVIKSLFLPYIAEKHHSFLHMGAASCGEVASCLIRVPTEVIKQRTQANSNISSLLTLQRTLSLEGISGLYRGYFSTVMREIPFSFIQFPIWEYLKKKWSEKQGYYVKSWQSSLCGGLAGAIAAAATTPIDVAKTRIMLANKGDIIASGHLGLVISQVWREKGIKGLFAGVVPRVIWISIGGIIFFGTYEKAKHVLVNSNS